MTGNASNISPYIIHNEIKLCDPRQQEPIFRDYWKNIFTAEDPNDNNFDYEFTENIENQLNERTERITPHNNTDINRLNINNCPTNFSHWSDRRHQSNETQSPRTKQTHCQPAQKSPSQLDKFPHRNLQTFPISRIFPQLLQTRNNNPHP